MNKSRRKKIEEIIEQLEALSLEIEEIRDEEDTAYENLPESMQNSEKGDKMMEATSNIDEAIDNISDAVSALKEAEQ